MKIDLRVFIFPLLLVSCGHNQIKDSHVGNCVGPFVDQKKIDGSYTCYFPDGKMSGIFVYKNGRQTGISKIYSRNGTLAATIEYKDNLMDGLTKEFDENGNIKIERNLKAGHLNGEYTEYWENKKIKYHSSFENGDEIGPASSYDKNGVKVNSPTKEAP